MRFNIYDEQERQEWAKLLGREVLGAVVYISHDEYLEHRFHIDRLRQDAADRKAGGGKTT
jgi:hypothetical protein